MDSAQIPIRATTQEHLPIEDILDNLVVLKDGSCALILAVSSVNFDLLSEKEQEAIIYAYASLLNSLTFPIQVVIRSQRKDISAYLNLLEKQESVKANNPLLSNMIKGYRKFVGEMVKKNNVLDKKFYVVIPFSALELGVAPTLTSIFKKTQSLPFTKDYILPKAKDSLFPKRDHLIKLFARIGLVARQMQTEELIKLFYNIYNSENSTTEKEAVQK
ncbi:MAG: hypothetical protein M1514_03070 [Patescibacteria group bacterium]|nr:hypothetical protein [Patescibacteria group bacterium]